MKTLLMLTALLMMGQAHKPEEWRFVCSAKSCPKVMPAGVFVMLDDTTGLFEECHPNSECRDIPRQHLPACKPDKRKDWFQTCVIEAFEKKQAFEKEQEKHGETLTSDSVTVDKSAVIPYSGELFTLSTTGTMPKLEAVWGDPEIKDGRKVYTLSLLPDWTCVPTTNSTYSGNILHPNPITLVTITCIKSDAPEYKEK